MTDELKFKQLQADIAEATTQKNKLEGQLESLKQRMKSDFGVDSIEELETQLKETEAQRLSLETRFNEGVSELESLMEGVSNV